MTTIIIKYKKILTNQILEKEFNNMSEEMAIGTLKRGTASSGIQLISINNKQDDDEENLRKELKTNEINKTIKNILSTVKSFIKKPYNAKNLKRNKTIICKYPEEVITFLNKNYTKIFNNDFIFDNKIEVSIMGKDIYIIPTEEYFMIAD